MKKFLRILALASFASVSLVFAETTEFRTPQRLTRGEMHWPLKPVEKPDWYEEEKVEYVDVPHKKHKETAWERLKQWWYSSNKPETKEARITRETIETSFVDSWSVDVWAGYYGVSAGQAFFKPNGGITTDTASLSALWFGTESFRGINVLAANPGSQTLSQINPFLGFARVSPTFTYSEKGAVFGLRTMRSWGCNDEWHTGCRLSLPVKKIDIEQDANIALEETLQDVVRQDIFNFSPSSNPSQIDFAYRLDFLSSIGYFSGNAFLPTVNYGDGSGSPLPSRITTVSGTPMVSSADTPCGNCPDVADCFPQAYVIRANGNITPNPNCCCPSAALVGVMPTPDPFFAKDCSQVTDFVRADGSGGNDGSVLFFKISGQDYLTGGLATNVDAQGSLFVVPRSTGSGSTLQLTEGSQQIYNQVSFIIEQAIEPLENASFFFAENGIDLFAHEHIVGVGDLTFEWYIGWGNRFDYYLDGVLGVIFPTGTSPCSANRIFHKPTGNNHHYEFKLGTEGGYNWCDSFALRGEAFYGHAFKGTESRAVSFTNPNMPCNVVMATPAPTITNPCCSQNSCCNAPSQCCSNNNNNNNNNSCATFLKNIGTPLCVDVSWDWFYGRLDLTIFHPYNDQLGITFGYEFYYKSKDHIDFDCCSTGSSVLVKDLLGQIGTVDFNAMERNTQVYSNKFYGEIFNRWGFFELFAGASQIIAGENVMKETEAHLGLRLYF